MVRFLAFISQRWAWVKVAALVATAYLLVFVLAIISHSRVDGDSAFLFVFVGFFTLYIPSVLAIMAIFAILSNFAESPTFKTIYYYILCPIASLIICLIVIAISKPRVFESYLGEYFDLYPLSIGSLTVLVNLLPRFRLLLNSKPDLTL